MADQQHRSSSHRSTRSERMEEDLNRSSFRGTPGDLAGWPTPERAPHTSRADSCEPSQGPAQPQKAIPVQEQPKEGNAAKAGPGAAPSQVGQAVGSCVDGRGGEAEMTLFTEQSAVGHHLQLSVCLRSRTRRLTPDRSGDTKTTASVLQDAYTWGHMWPSTLRSSGVRPPIFPRRSTGREPVLARPTTYGGRHDEDGTSTGRFDF
jgi:hypothetical protein